MRPDTHPICEGMSLCGPFSCTRTFSTLPSLNSSIWACAPTIALEGHDSSIVL